METKENNNKAQNVVIEEIYEAKEGNNPDYKTLQLRSVTIREKTGTLTSMLLGGNFEEQRVAFQTIHKDQVAKLGLAKGQDLSEKMGMDLRLTIREISESDHNVLPETGDANGFNKPAFKEKQTPSGDMLSTTDGEQIFRSVKLTASNAKDVYLENAPVNANPNAAAIEAETGFDKHSEQ